MCVCVCVCVGLDRTLILRGIRGERGGELFEGVGSCNFYTKNKVNSEILNDKKVDKQKCFLCHN